MLNNIAPKEIHKQNKNIDIFVKILAVRSNDVTLKLMVYIIEKPLSLIYSSCVVSLKGFQCVKCSPDLLN